MRDFSSGPEWLSINAVHDGAGRVINYIGVYSDIAVVKESQRRMEFLATHDELTALPNRVLFLDRIHNPLGGKRVVFCDVAQDFDVIPLCFYRPDNRPHPCAAFRRFASSMTARICSTSICATETRCAPS